MSSPFISPYSSYAYYPPFSVGYPSAVYNPGYPLPSYPSNVYASRPLRVSPPVIRPVQDVVITHPSAKKGALASFSHHMKQKDLWRETPLRYLGYVNEFGEAFKPILLGYLGQSLGQKTVLASHGIAMLYALADTVHKTMKGYHNHPKQSEQQRRKEAFLSGLGAFLFQLIASVVVPAQLVKGATKLAQNMISAGSLNKFIRNPRLKALLPTAVGLSIIPFIIKPIDHTTVFLIDCVGLKQAHKVSKNFE